MDYNINQVNGKTLKLNLNDDLQKHFDNPTNYAPTIINQINNDEFYKRFFVGKKDLVVLDIGANIGLFSLHVYPACKHIIAFEPTPSHYQKLEYLTSGTNVELRQKALSNTEGTTKFFLAAPNSTMNSLVQHYGNESLEVPCTTLSSILEQEQLDHVDFCKIDIEGSEMIAITHEEIAKVADKIARFYVEVHHTASINGNDLTKNKPILTGIFEDNGYKIEDIDYQTFCAVR
jgi:FkbM family methyltransferase